MFGYKELLQTHNLHAILKTKSVFLICFNFSAIYYFDAIKDKTTFKAIIKMTFWVFFYHKIKNLNKTSRLKNVTFRVKLSMVFSNWTEQRTLPYLQW